MRFTAAKKLNIVLSAALINSVFFSLAAGADTDRLKRDIVPIYQTINLKIDPRLTSYTGNVSITLSVKNSTNTFIIHVEDITIEELILSSQDKQIQTDYTPGEYGRTTITAAKMLEPGEYTLGISFAANFNTQAVGLYRTEVGDESYLFTQFEESDARKAFPCFDEPSFKFPYQMTVTIPKEHIAVSNTPIEIQAGDEKWQTISFKKTEPLPSYLLALAVGPLETVEVPDMPIPTRIVCVKGKSNLAEETARITPPLMKALVDYFERPYPYEKLDLIAVPEFWAGGMENAGAITFRETVILLDPKSISIGQKQSLVGVMAHELAHMWFGDLVTMRWW
ncbi:MAG: M1 family metallopeptidase, partial [Candidatus Zixiibacteriota bacterium]